MARYTTRVMSTAKPIVIGYRCSRCGQRQLAIKNVLAAESFSYQYSPHAGQENRAAGKLSDKIEKKYATTLAAIKSGNYRAANLECICHYCKSQEPWSFMRNSK